MIDQPNQIIIHRGLQFNLNTKLEGYLSLLKLVVFFETEIGCFSCNGSSLLVQNVLAKFFVIKSRNTLQNLYGSCDDLFKVRYSI